MNNKIKFGFYYEKSIRTSKGKEKATNDKNSVEQIGSSSGGQNEHDKSIRHSEDGNSSEQDKLGFCSRQGINTDKNEKKISCQMYFLTPKFKKT
ncbi:hypothetical protein F8M41_021015 [Gigaspora margarita]|uniref:Uncharacterized protein n=1 Tax=Gigaspora margarita TaxID=4874 RepID=A0A8H4B577_GIGMA|nr:hypothetical protein F8M41_021015 [Gigaspora margarita]